MKVETYAPLYVIDESERKRESPNIMKATFMENKLINAQRRTVHELRNNSAKDKGAQDTID